MKDEKPETYKIDLECTNCDAILLPFDIPEGETVRTFVEFEVCPNCKVRSLRKK